MFFNEIPLDHEQSSFGIHVATKQIETSCMHIIIKFQLGDLDGAHGATGSVWVEHFEAAPNK